MSRIREEIRVIPQTAWVLAITTYLLGATLFCFVAMPTDPQIMRWPLSGRIAFTYAIFLVFFAWVLLVGYVYADAKRRGMRYVLWTWLVILVPNAIGFILYFVLRDPLLKPCPHCATPARPSFVFCPACGTAIQPTCPNCSRGVEPGWSNCPHCGMKLPLPAPRSA